MSPKQLKSIIVGSYLGDGCIPKPRSKNSNCFLKIQHSIKQHEYIIWKSKLLGDFATTPIVINRTFKGKPYQCCSIQTKVHPFCSRLRKLYKDGRKGINRSILSFLDPLGLAIWYMDDGSVVRAHPKRKDGTRGPVKFRGVKIATCSFDSDEIELLRTYLLEKWGFNFKVYYSRNKEKSYPVLELFGAESKKFLELIGPYIPECMAYKTDIQQEACLNNTKTCSELHVYDEGAEAAEMTARLETGQQVTD